MGTYILCLLLWIVFCHPSLDFTLGFLAKMVKKQNHSKIQCNMRVNMKAPASASRQPVVTEL